MDYQARMRMALDQINTFLRAFQRPHHLDEVAAMGEMKIMAEEINSRISTSLDQSAFLERIAKALRHLRNTYTSRTWPTVGHVVKAMEQTQDRRTGASEDEEFTLDPVKLNAERIRAGKPVGDSWIYGLGAKTMLEQEGIPRETLMAYRSALFFAAKDVGGDEHAHHIEQELKSRPGEPI